MHGCEVAVHTRAHEHKISSMRVLTRFVCLVRHRTMMTPAAMARHMGGMTSRVVWWLLTMSTLRF